MDYRLLVDRKYDEVRPPVLTRHSEGAGGSGDCNGWLLYRKKIWEAELWGASLIFLNWPTFVILPLIHNTIDQHVYLLRRSYSWIGVTLAMGGDGFATSAHLDV